jgi:hypothetical protein
MGFYESEREAALWALRELQQYVPKKIDQNGIEWGTMIHRGTDPEGGYVYRFLTPEKGLVCEYVPANPPSWSSNWRDCAIVHTHPNDSGFSENDKTIAIARQVTIYMVTHSGAYFYQGKIEYACYGRDSHVRFGTLWGDPYPWALNEANTKVG